VATPFTEERLHASGLLSEELIVDDPAEVTAVVHMIIESA
jgi:hypothetical protein